MAAGLGPSRGNGEGSVVVRCSFPARAPFTSCRENYRPFVCVKGLLPLPSVQGIQWQPCVHAYMCVCVCVCAAVFFFKLKLDLFTGILRLKMKVNNVHGKKGVSHSCILSPVVIDCYWEALPALIQCDVAHFLIYKQSIVISVFYAFSFILAVTRLILHEIFI